MEIEQIIGSFPVRISLGITSKVDTDEATAATDPGLGLDPRVSPGFFSATNNGHQSAIHLIHLSIHHFRPFAYPSTSDLIHQSRTRHRPLFLCQALFILPVF